ncbi:hypothetical protein B0H16DRAFT_1727364 [Mycena metata]|uniref:Uncharacterized protein n=1 Tax=Mycena metata TaxID=1033252 RepID=A0AAD7IK81_9AGAR|nr:hypothetical protein B0H16DRAFT_1727364 [Mycena metata]
MPPYNEQPNQDWYTTASQSPSDGESRTQGPRATSTADKEDPKNKPLRQKRRTAKRRIVVDSDEESMEAAPVEAPRTAATEGVLVDSDNDTNDETFVDGDSTMVEAEEEDGVGGSDAEDAPQLSPAEEKRLQRNFECRVGQHQASVANPEKAVEQRKESGRGRASLVYDVWRHFLIQYVARETAVRSAANQTNASDLELVQAVIAAHCLAEGHTPIPPNAPVWASITPEVVELLAALARSPASFDLEYFLENGTLLISNRGDTPPQSCCAQYIRLVDAPKAKGTSAIYEHLATYPADAPTAILQLVLRGESMETICQKLSEAMEEYGLEGAKAPGDRAWDDVKKSEPVRFVHLVTHSNLKWTTFHIPALDTPILSPLDVRTDPEISQKERIVCAVLGTMVLNSAPGGVQPLFVPSAELLLLQQCTQLLLSPVAQPLGTERDAAPEQKIEKLIDDEPKGFRHEGFSSDSRDLHHTHDFYVKLLHCRVLKQRTGM